MLMIVSGAVGIAIANPTDLVKVRLQSEGRLAEGVPRRYTGAMNAYATIIRQVGKFTHCQEDSSRWAHAPVAPNSFSVTSIMALINDDAQKENVKSWASNNSQQPH